MIHQIHGNDLARKWTPLVEILTERDPLIIAAIEGEDVPELLEKKMEPVTKEQLFALVDASCQEAVFDVLYHQSFPEDVLHELEQKLRRLALTHDQKELLDQVFREAFSLRISDYNVLKPSIGFFKVWIEQNPSAAVHFIATKDSLLLRLKFLLEIFVKGVLLRRMLRKQSTTSDKQQLDNITEL